MMGTSMFKAGTIASINGVSAKFLRLLPSNIWQLEQVQTLRILEFSQELLHSMYSDGTLIFISDRTSTITSDKTGKKLTVSLANEEDWAAAKLRRLYVLEILNLPNSRVQIENAVQNLWNRLQMPANIPGYVTVYRWKRRYQAAGNDIQALLPCHSNKGNSKSRYPTEVENIVKYFRLIGLIFASNWIE